MKIKVLYSILALSLLLFTNAAVEAASSETILYMDPLTSTAPEGEFFTVDIKISDVEYLYAWQINLSWQASLLKLTNITFGDFLASQPEGTIKAWRIEQDKGWALFGEATVGQYLGVSGSGWLATVEFLVLGIGESVLNITNPGTMLIKQTSPFGLPRFEEIPFTPVNGFFTNLFPPEENHDVEITIDPTSTRIKPGNTATYIATVINTGTILNDIFDLSVTSTETIGKVVQKRIPSEWIILSKVSVILNPDQNETVMIEITVPEDWAAMENITYPFTVTAKCKVAPWVSDKAIARLIVEATKRSMAEYVWHELIWLKSDIEALQTNDGVKESLLSEINYALWTEKQALNYIIAGNETLANNMLTACKEILNAFIYEVEALSGEQITESEANNLIQQAQETIKDIEKTIITPIQ